MLQATMVEPGRIVFDEVGVPEVKDNEVLIKVMCIGICGSDIHVWHGKHPYTSYPVIQGHEFSGEIVETGSNVTGLKKGDKVVVQPQEVCGECYPCTHDQYNVCDNLKVMGFQTEGYAREYYTADQSKVLKLPPEMSYDEGALVEPLAVACHALGRSEMDLQGKKILVLGAGTIGNLVSQAARAKGAAKVMITDLSQFRLDLAEECGADVSVNVGKADLSEEIIKHFGPDKADLIMECVGAQGTITDAVNNARKGSDIIVVGVYPDEVMVNMGYVQDRELRLIGTMMYREADYREAIELIARGDIKTDKIVTDHFAFKDYNQAYQHIEKQQDKAIKVMIDVG